MAWTQQNIDDFKAAMLKSGVVKSITFDNQTLTFRTFEENQMFLAQMEREVNAARPQYRRRFAAFCKGV